jgi:Mg chelatase-related protein
MIATTHSMKLTGIDGTAVLVECETIPGKTGIHLVGLADEAVRNSLIHVASALQSQGYNLPGSKIVINVAPPDPIKTGGGHDLAIALAIIAASGQHNGLDDDGSGNLTNLLYGLKDWLVYGELDHKGNLLPVPGCVQAVEAAIAAGCRGVVIPQANAMEVRDIFTEDDIPIYAVKDIINAIGAIAGPDYAMTVWELPEEKKGAEGKTVPAWDALAGREAERRTLEVAAAGGHHLLLAGPVGGGKDTLARAILDILPPVTREEALAIAKVYSASGAGQMYAHSPEGNHSRPFRAPHHSCPKTALFGECSGASVVPGEFTRAHKGVLFLNEIAEAPKFTFEALRGPLEDKEITISRLNSKVTLPADFQLVAGTSLCPCGRYGDGDSCHCTPGRRSNYLSKLGNPLFDHIDVHLFVRKREPDDATAVLPEGESRESVAFRVQKARETQRLRFGDGRLNADMKAKDIEKHCVLGEEEKTVIERVMDALGLSYRSYTRILKVARTIADLAGEKDIHKEHLLEAAGYRFLDRRELIPCADGFDAAKDIRETTAKRS